MFKKIVLLFFIFLFPCSCVNSEVLQGQVSYTADSARKIAFDGIRYSVNKYEYIDPFLTDVNKQQNMNALKYGMEISGRELELIQTGPFKAYAVTYKDNPYISYFYSYGRFLGLLGININEEPAKTKYPYRSYKYDINGNLVNVSLNVAYGDNYNFAKDGTLESHCKDDYCYDLSGKVICKRKILE